MANCTRCEGQTFRLEGISIPVGARYTRTVTGVVCSHCGGLAGVLDVPDNTDVIARIMRVEEILSNLARKAGVPVPM